MNYEEFVDHLSSLGLPELYANMVAINTDPRDMYSHASASRAVMCCFIWTDSEQGREFWHAVYLDCVNLMRQYL
jgi:hypothetical protein